MPSEDSECSMGKGRERKDMRHHEESRMRSLTGPREFVGRVSQGSFKVLRLRTRASVTGSCKAGKMMNTAS